MAELKISEMVAASQSEMTDGTLIETSIEDESSSTGYSTRKGLLSQVANYVLNAFRGLSLGGAVRSVKEAIDSLQNGKVNKSGDTMTNDLVIERSNTAQTRLKSTEYSATIGQPCPSSATSLGRVSFWDKDNTVVGWVSNAKNENDYLFTEWSMRRPAASGSPIYQQYARMGITSTGAYDVSLSQPAAWCAALGTGTYLTATLKATVIAPTGSTTNVLSLSLNKGMWIVLGQISSQHNGGTAGAYRGAKLGSTAGGTQYGNVQVPTNNGGGNTVIQVMGIANLTAAGTVYLSFTHASGVNVTIPANVAHIYAVRIASL